MIASLSIRRTAALAAALGTIVTLAARTSAAQGAPQSASPDSAHAIDARTPSTASHLAMLGVGMIGASLGGQVIGSPTKWPRTWSGYGKRVGDQIGFTAVEEGVQFAVGRALPWHDDHSPCGVGVRRAVSCGITRTFTLRATDGSRRPDLPFIAGVLAGTSASLIWRPEAARAPKARGFFATRVGIVLGAAVVTRAYEEWKASR
ncbi:MAG: hypothetical protein V4617_09340 [Gemmatimonadota bacterium]